MAGRPKKNNSPCSVYLSPESSQLLNRLRAKKTNHKELSSGTKNIKETFLFSEQTEDLLECLQRDSKDRKDKKPKGWFIDQALESYVQDKDDDFFKQLEKDQQEKGNKKSKAWFIEEALKIKYSAFLESLQSPSIHV